MEHFDELINPKKQTLCVDSWRLFRILSEFVDGFETMTSLGPSIAIFGSTNQNPIEKKYYDLAENIAKKIVEKGFGVITGGGPGIMERANKGAREGKGKSCGLCVNLPGEAAPNEYIDEQFLLNFRYFFVRKVMFVRYAQAFVVLPGGFGTLDELFESLTLVQTKKIQKFPIFLVGKDYWSGLLDWLKNTVLKHGNIKQSDLDLIRLSDDPNEIALGIEDHFVKANSIKNF